MASRPQTRYAASGGVGIAYQEIGEGALDLVLAFPFVSHLDLLWDSPAIAGFIRRLAGFARVLAFDRRGVGLSDPVSGAPTLEERMDDVRAVMDAAGSERASLLGMSEGATMCMLFAASCPNRTSALLLWGAMARSTAAPDYPFAAPRESFVEANQELIAPLWGQGATIEIFSPSLADDPRARDFQARLERGAATPMRVWELSQLFLDTDVRDALPLIQAPTLVMHRTHDRAVNVRAARWLAEQIEGSRLLEFEGQDHFPWVGDSEPPLAAIEEFLTGVRPRPSPERVLATVVFTDIVDSTGRAASLGDRHWRRLLEEHQRLVREHLERFEGHEVKTTGDGFLATFTGPTRAVEFARSVSVASPELGVEIRAGIHTGELELMAGGDVGGIAVHVAARICGMAGGATILASRTVRDLTIGSGLDLTAEGSHELKGVPGSWELFRVAVDAPEPKAA